MKLNNNSIFDKAVVVTLIDDKLYYGNASMYMLDAAMFESDEPGILIYNGVEFNGRCAFWVEDDDVFPIVSCNGFYLVIEDDYQYEYLKSRDVLTKDQIRLIEEGFNVLNDAVIIGGLIV